jgi:membrane fusion protein, copper/silver efflux system
MNLPRRTIPTALLGAGIAILAIGAGLLVQDARHGWPFDRHHAPAVARPASTNAAAHTAGAHAQATGAARGPVAIDSSKLAQLGVQFETAALAELSPSARFPAVLTPDESRLSHIHARVNGWIERLHVNTGDRVRRGDPLASVFSQELLASQSEYLAALQRGAAPAGSAVQAAARTRLGILGMSERDIDRLEKSGVVQRLMTISAPRAGVVLRRGVTPGTSVDPATEIMTIADLSRLWALAEVTEAEASAIARGSKAWLSFPAANREPIEARVDFIYPTLTERTRSVRVRLTLGNPEGALRPGVYGTATFALPARAALSVPRDAIVDTGESQHVFVRRDDGRLEPRPIKSGARFADRVEVLEGLAAGDAVAVSGVFLIDSESRLRASGDAPATDAHAGHGG